MGNDLRKLIEERHRDVVKFLTLELELGFIFVARAKTKASVKDRHGFEESRQRSVDALAPIRRFESRVAHEERHEMRLRSLELERAIQGLHE